LSGEGLVVVKLGGSYAGSPLLRPWVRAVEAAAGRVVLVPGGGPFADAVRAAQTALGFDDEAADAMAMLAMAQFGIALCSLGALLAMTESVVAIEAALDSGGVPVWAPLAMVRGEAGLPRNWDVTSDSLALWLAWRLGAVALLLVKQRDGGVTDLPGGAGVLVDARIKSGHDASAELVDAYFPRLHAIHPCPVFVAGPRDLPAAGLDPDRLPGIWLAA
jgi:aspartokinase-like uncharacterized kinase